jgi:TonB family protein
MKRYIPLLLFIGLAWGQTIKITLFDYTSKGIKNTNSVKFLRNAIEKELIKAKKYKIKQKNAVVSILEKEGFQLIGCDTECFVNIGSIIGVGFVISGNVQKFGHHYNLRIKIHDVSSRQLADEFIVKSNEGLDDLIVQAPLKIMNSLDKEAARIASEEKAAAELVAKLAAEEAARIASEEKAAAELIAKLAAEEAARIAAEEKAVAELVAKLAAEEAARIAIKSLKTKPKPITPIRPVYPEFARVMGSEGKVVVLAFIDAKGWVKKTMISEGSQNSLLDEAALKAILETRFSPAITKGGQAVPVWLKIPINFKL